MKTRLALLLTGLLAHTSCNRFLEAVPNRSLALLTSVAQYEQMLHADDLYMNAPPLPDISADEYRLETVTWQSQSVRNRNAYAWLPDIYEGSNASGIIQDWRIPYYVIYTANVVIDGLEESVWERDAHFNEVLAQALFIRAMQHFFLQETYGQPFVPGSSGRDPGIPLRLTSNLEAAVSRATVQETFDRITGDLLRALPLFGSAYPSGNPYWGSKAAVCALLSRAYLAMQDYTTALRYADACLGHYDRLLDFNALPSNHALPTVGHPEILAMVWQGATSGLFARTSTFVSDALYDSYADADLRKHVFFRETPDGTVFGSFYTGSLNPFAGLATDEVYLNRAECRARLGDAQGALDDLNTLRRHRYAASGFTELDTRNTGDVLPAVLDERRRELVVRGMRWTDLRRLNQDPRFAVTLTRDLDRVYTLPPNDPRYALEIPSFEVAVSGIPQNPR